MYLVQAAGVRLSTNPDDEKGAQHYMQCIQFDVQSDGDAFPVEDELVAFPGAYSGDEPGLTLDIWDMPVENYTVSVLYLVLVMQVIAHRCQSSLGPRPVCLVSIFL